jgi:hypothetical protein
MAPARAQVDISEGRQCPLGPSAGQHSSHL